MIQRAWLLSSVQINTPKITKSPRDRGSKDALSKVEVPIVNHAQSPTCSFAYFQP